MLFFLPDLIMVQEEAGLRVLNPKTATAGRAHMLAVSGMGVVDRVGSGCVPL